ncbi:P-loop containing nucleoside triphosphate hydrolase protein [Microstroma glucosiphilum]|uniref:RNA helicase n=1 Tax=Pseudomicrostroma glucosiphilum TaxID=1684307 RepID=A0A316U837_9BASI|nr:P-loop containing nucleoside triphosphate hydrolase protein [Pseudomicrostroma glucosiphilum]PWN21409.1 P-loop containing nucleoside triphosphate hydrolase protein [Pseudomicrostroma glucosiphilum]
MAKKKKPTLKSSVNRGFATTSVPSKKPVETPAEEEAKDEQSNGKGQAATASSASQAVSGAGAIPRKEAGAGNGEADFEVDSEEMELQLLVERLNDRAEREVTRLWKAIDFDRRMSSSLPSFEVDGSTNERALALAANGISRLDLATTSTSASTTEPASGAATPSEAGGQRSVLPTSALTPLPSNLLDEDKLYIRALTTYGLLQKLGFSTEEAERALRATTGPYDLEDCIAYLVSVLDEQEMTAVERRQKGLETENSGAEGESSSSTDTSIPPQHLAYSFERSVGPRGGFNSQAKGKTGKKTNGESTPAVADVTDLEAAELTNKLRSLSMSCLAIVSDLETEISEGSSGSGLMDTLESPSTAWARARLGMIKLDRLKGQQTKLVRTGANENVMKDSERQRDFDREGAAEYLRQERTAWEETLVEADDGKGREAIASTTAADGEEPDSEEDHSQAQSSAQATPSGAATPNEQATIENGNKDEHADEEGGDMFGGLLDETPQEVVDASTGVTIKVRALPTTIKGGRTPRALLAESLRRLDPTAHTRFDAVLTGGRICRSRLTLRWSGPEGKKSSQSYLDIFQLTGEGAESASAAEDMLATVALNCIERDRPTYRSLPGPYREWYEELERYRKTEKSAKAVETLKQIKTIVQPRLDEIEARKAQAKAGNATSIDVGKVSDSDGQSHLGALTQGAVKPLNEQQAARQREQIQEKMTAPSYQKMLPQRQSLPIYKYRDHILDILDNNQVFVLSGETGCGKSTQIPAYILEHCMSQGKPCKIYCTEPRRISAISLAERVSQELGEPRGAVGGDSSLVGYAIRLDSHIGREAKLVYATSGILLRMLEGTSVNEVTHIIIDEVHERSIESDFLLIILKTLIQYRKDLKVILMSATLDAERISAYCGGCAVIQVPGRTFPVQTNYLEDAVELTGYIVEDDSQYAVRQRRDKYGRKADVPGNKAKLQSTADDEVPPDDDDDEDERQGTASTSLKGQRYSPKTISTMDRMDEYVINHDLIVSLIERICFSPDLEQFSPAILVFMPGLQDIRKLHDLLLSHRAFGSQSFIVSPLHSTLSSEEQSSVFNIPPKGMRKIVISTNIAETGVTIPDVTEMRFDEKRQTSKLVDCFVAKSNAKQRRGRAGRVQEGICFHLFTKERHDKHLADHPLPEMLRLSLQDLALKLKIMKIRIGNSVGEALAQALDPPSPVNVQRAVSALIEVKALTTTEEITPLGRHLARIPLDVHMGKFLLIATLFKCLDAALTTAAALNSKSPFVTPFGREAEADAAKASFRVGNSDFLTIANAFNSWRRAIGQKHHFVFCRKSFLSHQTLQQIEELRQQYMAFLLDTGFAQVDEATKQKIVGTRYRSGGGSQVRLMETPASLDSNGHSIAVLHAALAVGLYPKLLAIDPRSYQIRTIGNNQPAAIHPSSINFRLRLGDLPKGVSNLVYFTIMQSRRLYARETAPVLDAALLLLCGDVDYKFSCNSIYIDRNKLRFRLPSLASLLSLKLLREQLSRLITASFRSPGKPALGAFANEADRFKNV